MATEQLGLASREYYYTRIIPTLRHLDSLHMTAQPLLTENANQWR